MFAHPVAYGPIDVLPGQRAEAVLPGGCKPRPCARLEALPLPRPVAPHT